MHGIITDTPVYEKNGWTGDAQLTSGAASLLFDTERLYEKMFQDMADAQTAQGEVPLLAPATATTATSASLRSSPTDCCGATPAWDAFWFVLPWESYRRYGDLRGAASGRFRSCRSTSTCGSRSGRAGTATSTPTR